MLPITVDVRRVRVLLVGDGEAETGALATGWHSNKFLDPRRDGAVLPILHLNGYKIAGPTVLGREDDDAITRLLSGHGYDVHVVSGTDPMIVHRELASTLDLCWATIRSLQDDARRSGLQGYPRWPAIVLRTPKGWTGPKVVDGQPVEVPSQRKAPQLGIPVRPAGLGEQVPSAERGWCMQPPEPRAAGPSWPRGAWDERPAPTAMSGP